jgi:hypothetical protein
MALWMAHKDRGSNGSAETYGVMYGYAETDVADNGSTETDGIVVPP